jgi:hypothetical protein
MNVIIEPLSEQAWRRVEVRLMKQLEERPPRYRQARSIIFRPCDFLHACTKLRTPWRSLLQLLSSHELPRGSSDVAPNDAAPKSSVSRSPQTNGGPPDTVRSMAPYRGFRSIPRAGV